jgi:hypothetical protein
VRVLLGAATRERAPRAGAEVREGEVPLAQSAPAVERRRRAL